MMVWSNANVYREHDGRKSGLPSAPLDREYGQDQDQDQDQDQLS